MYVLIVVLYNYRLRLKEHISSKKSKDAYICSFFPKKFVITILKNGYLKLLLLFTHVFLVELKHLRTIFRYASLDFTDATYPFKQKTAD